ncbi:MAG: peptidoglycan editing factor PgeF [Propionivibrio sp.]
MTTSTEIALNSFITPDWPAPPNVRSLITTRQGGVSQGVYSSLNLGDHVNDDPAAVARNRALVSARIDVRALWLRQVHGTRAVDAAACLNSAPEGVPEADAAWTRRAGVACVVMTADCLPVLLCDRAGTVVAAAHAGWRGLLDGVLEATVDAMGVVGEELIAYLGPAIGPQAFEVGDEVRSAFVGASKNAAAAFQPGHRGKWLADIYRLARLRLLATGVEQIHGGDFCTVTDAVRFFSYRRDGQTGRMASMIWLDRSRGAAG